MKKFLCVISVIAVCGCGDLSSKQEIPLAKDRIKSQTDYDSMGTTGTLLTVVHDNHWFIVEGRFSKGAMLHHPDCPCGKGK